MTTESSKTRADGHWDVIVVGAGHAGCEAALAAARCGATVALLTMSETALASMPCNPSIGGPGKGHLVREIDALGGVMGEAADAAAMQAKLLNTSKGPAVQALRVVVDKAVYQAFVRQRLLAARERVELVVGEAQSITGAPGGPYCVGLDRDRQLVGTALILATGVYLRATTVIGEAWRQGGPGAEAAADFLSESLRRMGLSLGRFKTGTSPRIDFASADLDLLPAELSDGEPLWFSHLEQGARPSPWGGDRPSAPVCWRTATNALTHSIIEASFGRSPLLTGQIVGRGPRHCPSVEDKIARFPDRTSHPVYLERERRDGNTLYLLGLSTSLPHEVQAAMVASIVGLAGARITAYGYAIEYDYVDPTQLHATMEAKRWPGLFFAGQVCGTSGYEEAAALGVVAGVNAARRAKGLPQVVFARSESYIGVLTSDLALRGVREPYRIMTARAEHRLHLRQTNADLRLTAWGRELGIVSEDRYQALVARRERLRATRAMLQQMSVRPDGVSARWLAARGTAPLREPIVAAALLARPEVQYRDLVEIVPTLPRLNHDDRHEVAADAKYGGYIAQQERLLARQRQRQRTELSSRFDYRALAGLSAIGRERLCAAQPLSLEEAMLVPGISPADVAVLEAVAQGLEQLGYTAPSGGRSSDDGCLR